MKLVIGLGEPSRDLLGSRGNIGAMVIDGLCDKHSIAKLKPSHSTPQLEINDYMLGTNRVILCKSTVSVKETGALVAQLIKGMEISKTDVIVVQDDIDFPFGEVKLRDCGGDGGHDGVRGIASALSCKTFVRVRVGVGRNFKGKTRKEYLDQVISKEDLSVLIRTVYRSADAVDHLVENGLRPTQKKFHKNPNDDTAWISEVPPELMKKEIPTLSPIKRNPISRDQIVVGAQGKQHPAAVFFDKTQLITGPNSAPVWPGATVTSALEAQSQSPTPELKLLPAHVPEKKMEVRQMAGPTRPPGNGTVMHDQAPGMPILDGRPQWGVRGLNWRALSGFGLGSVCDLDFTEEYYQV